jgi:hypothetical protein
MRSSPRATTTDAATANLEHKPKSRFEANSPVMVTCVNRKYWSDLIAEGRGLTQEAEGAERDMRVALNPEDRAEVHRVAQAFRDSINDQRFRDPDRVEHHLQDVIDVYRALHPRAHRMIGPRGIPKASQ